LAPRTVSAATACRRITGSSLPSWSRHICCSRTDSSVAARPVRRRSVVGPPNLEPNRSALAHVDRRRAGWDGRDPRKFSEDLVKEVKRELVRDEERRRYGV